MTKTNMGTMSAADKIGEAMLRAIPRLPGETGESLKAMLMWRRSVDRQALIQDIARKRANKNGWPFPRACSSHGTSQLVRQETYPLCG